jgi:phage portal protein BeeE
MGLTDLFFGNAISKRVSEQLAVKQSASFASALSYINIGMNTGLPTINPDAIDYYKIFKTIGAVYEVTDIITKKVLKCPFVFYKVTNKAKYNQSKLLFKSDPVQSLILKATSTTEVELPDLHKLLTIGMANPYQTGSQMMWTSVLSFLLQGNTYIHHIDAGSKPKEFYCFPNMEIAADLNDLLDPIRGYILQCTEMTRFAPEEVQHVKTGTPAPVDRRMEYLYGVSPVRSAFESLRSIKEGKIQASKQARNGGALAVVAPKNKEDTFGKEQKDQFKERLIDAHSSNDPMARIMPSSIPLEVLQIGLPISDLQLLELVGASEEDVYRAYHWPLQYHDQSGSTFSNQAAAIVQGIYDGVAPVCDTFGEAITLMCSKGYGFDVCELDYTQLPEMAVNMKEVAAFLKELPEGVLTPNEMRTVLKWGEKKEAYMNEHYISSKMTTMSKAAAVTAPVAPVAGA